MTVGTSRPWVTATASVLGLPTIRASVSGADVVPLVGALGVAMLAAFGAVVATRGVARMALGAAVLIAAAVVVVACIRVPGVTGQLTAGLSAKGWSGGGGYHETTTVWRWLVLLSSLAAGLAGGVTAVYGREWAEMGSRYDAPTRETPETRRPEELSENDVWRAIDQGRDPTHDL